MRIWKVLKGLDIVAYVKVASGCKICDTSYAALQLVRSKFSADKDISGTQLLDISAGERMLKDVPVYQLK